MTVWVVTVMGGVVAVYNDESVMNRDWDRSVMRETSSCYDRQWIDQEGRILINQLEVAT